MGILRCRGHLYLARDRNMGDERILDWGLEVGSKDLGLRIQGWGRKEYKH